MKVSVNWNVSPATALTDLESEAKKADPSASGISFTIDLTQGDPRLAKEIPAKVQIVISDVDVWTVLQYFSQQTNLIPLIHKDHVILIPGRETRVSFPKDFPSASECPLISPIPKLHLEQGKSRSFARGPKRGRQKDKVTKPPSISRHDATPQRSRRTSSLLTLFSPLQFNSSVLRAKPPQKISLSGSFGNSVISSLGYSAATMPTTLQSAGRSHRETSASTQENIARVTPIPPRRIATAPASTSCSPRGVDGTRRPLLPRHRLRHRRHAGPHHRQNRHQGRAGQAAAARPARVSRHRHEHAQLRQRPPRRLRARRLSDRGLSRPETQASSSRTTPAFSRASSRGPPRKSLNALGIDALLFPEDRSTPQLSFTTRTAGAQAGIMITASHNPSHDNGMKFYSRRRRAGRRAPRLRHHGAFQETFLRSRRAARLLKTIKTPGKIVILEPEMDVIYRDAVANLVLEPEAILETREKSSSSTRRFTAPASAPMPALLDQFDFRYSIVEAQSRGRRPFPYRQIAEPRERRGARTRHQAGRGGESRRRHGDRPRRRPHGRRRARRRGQNDSAHRQPDRLNHGLLPRERLIAQGVLTAPTARTR